MKKKKGHLKLMYKTLEAEFIDFKENDDAKNMQRDYFKIMLEEKEREIAELTERVNILKACFSPNVNTSLDKHLL